MVRLTGSGLAKAAVQGPLSAQVSAPNVKVGVGVGPEARWVHYEPVERELDLEVEAVLAKGRLAEAEGAAEQHGHETVLEEAEQVERCVTRSQLNPTSGQRVRVGSDRAHPLVGGAGVLRLGGPGGGGGGGGGAPLGRGGPGGGGAGGAAVGFGGARDGEGTAGALAKLWAAAGPEISARTVSLPSSAAISIPTHLQHQHRPFSASASLPRTSLLAVVPVRRIQTWQELTRQEPALLLLLHHLHHHLRRR